MRVFPSSFIIFFILFFSAHVTAQSEIQVQNSEDKIITIIRTNSAPIIDGVLNDSVWGNAVIIDKLHQVNPVEYAEPSERTEIRLMFDDDALYVGIRLYMAHPDEIAANLLRQGGNINSDDTVYVTLDPFNNQRSGYFFGINPNGVRSEGLYRNVSEYYDDWDAIFYAEAGRFDGGWTAEFEIPFKSLSFDPNSDTWGLNFSRSIKSLNEDIAWVSRNRRWDPSSAGKVSGLTNLDQGLGLDIVPSMSLNTEKRFIPGTQGDVNSNFEPSLDASYKVTSSLNASVTLNTDFSATEVDDRQVNLTRFSLFFPEKRDFFLREADIFEFGLIGAQGGFGGGQNGRPFFSRNIGLGAGGQVVGLDYGAKVSGRIGGWELGALSIRQENNLSVNADNLSVLRAKTGIGKESTLGMIYTEGDPNSNVNNYLAGVDYLYRNTSLSQGRILEVSAWYQQSDTEGLNGDDSAGGIGFSVPSSTGLRGGASFKQFQNNFNPALGFVNRSDIDNSAADIGYTYRPESNLIQEMFFEVSAERYESASTGELESEQIGFTPLELTTRSGDVLFLRSNFKTEVLTQPFQVSPGIVIPVGKYDFNDHGIEFRTASYRKLAASYTYIRGDFYNGDLVRTFGSVTWQPTPKIKTRLGFNITEIELPNGSFDTRVLSAGFDYVFSSTLSWVNLIQYDNVSETAGINLRLHWIPEAGQEIFFVINHTLQDYDHDNRFNSAYTNATIKASYTYRF